MHDRTGAPRTTSRANRIRELREAAGLTLADLGARVGATNQQISHLELGKRQLTVEWLKRLAVALDCHPWEVVEQDDLLPLLRKFPSAGRNDMVQQIRKLIEES